MLASENMLDRTDKLPELVPALSVIIPAHNEEKVLARCLDALLADSEAGELEILVAANGCTDRTVEIARSYGDRVGVIEIPEASKHAALLYPHPLPALSRLDDGVADARRLQRLAKGERR